MNDNSVPNVVYLEENDGIIRNNNVDEIKNKILLHKEKKRISNKKYYDKKNENKVLQKRGPKPIDLTTLSETELKIHHDKIQQQNNKKLVRLAIGILDKRKEKIGLFSYKKLNNILVFIERNNI